MKLPKTRAEEMELDSFQPIAQRAPRRESAFSRKGSERRIKELEEANSKLSMANLSLNNILKRATHWVPTHLREEYERLKSLANEGEFEVHP